MEMDKQSESAIQRSRRKEAEKITKYLEERSRKKMEELEELSSPRQTNSERQQEFDQRIALFDGRMTQFFEDDRDFMNKPVPPTRPLYAKPATFYPFPNTLKMLLDAIMKVDEAFNAYKVTLDLMMVNKVNGALTHFACVLCDTLETDQARMAFQYPKDIGMATKDDYHQRQGVYERGATRKTSTEETIGHLMYTDIHHAITTTHAQIMLLKQNIVQFHEKKDVPNSRNIIVEKDDYLEMKHLLELVRNYALPVINGHINKITKKRLNRELEEKERRKLNQCDEHKNIGNPSAENNEKNTNEDCKIQEEAFHLRPNHCRLRIPRQKDIENSLFVTAGCLGLGVATVFAIRYFTR